MLIPAMFMKGGAGGGGGGSDPYFSSVKLLLGFDSATNGSQAVSDESSAGTAVTFTGASTLVDNTHTMFTSAEALKLATTNGFISVPNSSAFSISNSNDKTYEAWVYLNGTNTGINMVFDKRSSSSAQEFSFYVSNGLGTGKLALQTFISGSVDLSLTGTTSVTLNAWHHVAFCRKLSGGVETWYIFLDGNLEAQGNQTGTPTSNTNAMRIGSSAFNTTRYFSGWMDEIRITDGVARYTASFTAPTAKFPRS